MKACEDGPRLKTVPPKDIVPEASASRVALLPFSISLQLGPGVMSLKLRLVIMREPVAVHVRFMETSKDVPDTLSLTVIVVFNVAESRFGEICKSCSANPKTVALTRISSVPVWASIWVIKRKTADSELLSPGLPKLTGSKAKTSTWVTISPDGSVLVKEAETSNVFCGASAEAAVCWLKVPSIRAKIANSLIVVLMVKLLYVLTKRRFLGGISQIHRVTLRLISPCTSSLLISIIHAKRLLCHQRLAVSISHWCKHNSMYERLLTKNFE